MTADDDWPLEDSPLAAAIDAAWLDLGIEQDVNLVRLDREPGGRVFMTPWWWRHTDDEEVARVSLVGGELVFDPTDPWLIPAARFVEAGESWIRALLGPSVSEAVRADRPAAWVQAGPDLALLGRLAVGDWLVRWGWVASPGWDRRYLEAELAALRLTVPRQWLQGGDEIEQQRVLAWAKLLREQLPHLSRAREVVSVLDPWTSGASQPPLPGDPLTEGWASPAALPGRPMLALAAEAGAWPPGAVVTSGSARIDHARIPPESVLIDAESDVQEVEWVLSDHDDETRLHIRVRQGASPCERLLARVMASPGTATDVELRPGGRWYVGSTRVAPDTVVTGVDVADDPTRPPGRAPEQIMAGRRFIASVLRARQDGFVALADPLTPRLADSPDAPQSAFVAEFLAMGPGDGDAL